MLQTMVSLLDTDRTIHVQVHDGLVDLTIAALSAEPVTIEELKAAMGRYMEPEVVDFYFAQAEEGLAVRSTEGGHVIIDFTARLVVSGSSAPDMPRLGCVLRCDEHATLDVWLPYRIPEQWQMTTDTRNWRELARRRQPVFAEDADFDARAVLYTKLAEALIERWLAADGPWETPVTEIQDWWLLTPREDLHGRTPRDVLLAKHRFVDGDVQDQGENWSLLGRCPPGLAPRSHAYRYGGFGTHEIILYHELAAVLLCEIERRVSEDPLVDLHREISHLEQFQQEWMHQPQADLYDQSPAALIARERARLPTVIPKGHEHLDHDCPLCRMMADSDQPMIWQLDNYLLERRFSTSFCQSRAEWERGRRESEDVDPDWEPPSPLPSDRGFSDDQRIWQNSFTNMTSLTDMPAWESVNVMLFAVGGHLAELVHDLRSRADTDELVQQLHVRFDELRVFVKEQRELFIIRGTIGDFVEALTGVAQVRDDLRQKCVDLETKLDFLEERYAKHLDQDLEATY
jgi:hypothetical protein